MGSPPPRLEPPLPFHGESKRRTTQTPSCHAWKRGDRPGNRIVCGWRFSHAGYYTQMHGQSGAPLAPSEAHKAQLGTSIFSWPSVQLPARLVRSEGLAADLCTQPGHKHARACAPPWRFSFTDGGTHQKRFIAWRGLPAPSILLPLSLPFLLLVSLVSLRPRSIDASNRTEKRHFSRKNIALFI